MKFRFLLTALVAASLCGPAHAAKELTDIACETSATAGTGTLNLDGALTGGYLGFAAAGITSGAEVPYSIENGTQLETGWGIFTDAAPDTLTRVADWSTDGVGAELTLSGTSTVCIGPIASIFDDYATLPLADATTTGKGVSELATSAEAEAQTDTARTVTPSSLANFALLSEVLDDVNLQIFTANGTYTPTSGIHKALIIATGGGGGGGGADTDGSGGAGGGGGGGAASCIAMVDSAEIGANATVTVGGGGAGGSNTGGNGGAGVDTTVNFAGTGTTMTADGGAAGNGSSQTGDDNIVQFSFGGLTASNTGCDLSLAGGFGNYGASRGVDSVPAVTPGSGGGTFWGTSLQQIPTLDAAQLGTGCNAGADHAGLGWYGHGGPGAFCIDNATGATGGSAHDGVVFILEFLAP